LAGPHSRLAYLAAAGHAMSATCGSRRLAAAFVAPCAARITIVACLLLAGCVPVPFKPSATVSQTPVTADNAVPLVSAASGRSEAHSVAKAIREEDPRVVLVSAAAFSDRIGAVDVALTDVLAIARAGQQPLAADYILSVGEPTHRQLHDTGAAGFFYITVVGYEKTQSIDSLPATLLDLRDPKSLQVLCASSAYSEVTTGLVYGVMTIGLPEPGLRKALAREVTRTLAEAQPAGAIRLLVVSQGKRAAAASSDSGCTAGAPPGGTTAALAH
jgi:acyl-CoA synthetase (AMP-forming)/AMP-acid ligase II